MRKTGNTGSARRSEDVPVIMLNATILHPARRWITAALIAGAMSIPTIAAPAVAAEPTPPAHTLQKPGGGTIDCDATDQDNELLACARKDLEAGQKRLDVLVKETMASLPPEGKTTFEAAHKAWVAYRDADCRWNAYDIETGRSSDLILMSCLADLTISRMEELEAGINPQ